MTVSLIFSILKQDNLDHVLILQLEALLIVDLDVTLLALSLSVVPCSRVVKEMRLGNFNMGRGLGKNGSCPRSSNFKHRDPVTKPFADIDEQAVKCKVAFSGSR